MLLTPNHIIDELSFGSKKLIKMKCDYCFKPFERGYRRYQEVKNNSNINKDFCRNCVKIKNIEELLISVNSDQIPFILNYLIENNIFDFSGVYCLRNKLNNKSYIGSSKNVLNRLKSHEIEMNNSTHYCNDFNSVELNDLEFIILELGTIEEKLIENEYNYINLFNTIDSSKGYNIMSKKRYRKTKRKMQSVKMETKVKHSKLSINDVKEIKISLHNGERINILAERYNVNHTTIQDIKSCNTWHDVLPELNEKLKNIKYVGIHKGSNNGCSKLTEDQVREIKGLIESGKTLTDIGKVYNVSRTLIGHIKRGKLWSHVS